MAGLRIDGKAARRIIKAYSRERAIEKPGRDARRAKQSVKRENKGAITMKKEDIKKVVLAYSGGLDTSIIMPR